MPLLSSNPMDQPPFTRPSSAIASSVSTPSLRLTFQSSTISWVCPSSSSSLHQVFIKSSSSLHQDLFFLPLSHADVLSLGGPMQSCGTFVQPPNVVRPRNTSHHITFNLKKSFTHLFSSPSSFPLLIPASESFSLRSESFVRDKRTSGPHDGSISSR